MKKNLKDTYLAVELRTGCK